MGDVRLRPLRRSPPTATSGTPWPSGSRAATTPTSRADDTLLVARVTGDGGSVRATLFNYACHPTTLAWENRLLSPDYIGAAREVLEQRVRRTRRCSSRAPRAISAPRDDYVGDTAVADRNGRQLGLRRRGRDRGAAASRERASPTRASSPRARTSAPGSTSRATPEQLARRASSSRHAARHVELARKEDLGVVESLSGATPDSPQEREKALRREFLEPRARRRPRPPDADLGRGGSARRCSSRSPNEPYSVFQIELRRALRRARRSRPDDDERRRRLPAAAGDLRRGPLPGAAVALRARAAWSRRSRPRRRARERCSPGASTRLPSRVSSRRRRRRAR